MKRSFVTLAGAMAILASAAAPALAATSLAVPFVASAPSLDPKDGSGFGTGAVATLNYDTAGSSAERPATVRVERDNTALYVRFEVSQSAPIIGFAGGDSVAVDLWPAGDSSDRYHLGANLDGSRTADSTSNTSDWQTAVATHSGGYTVTMKIPIAVVADSASTRIQFSRWISANGEEQLWSHSTAQSADDVAQAGTLTLATVSKN